MAGTAAKPRKRAKQKRLEAVEDERIREVEDAAEEYKEARDARMKMTPEEKAAKTKLTDVMKKHGLSVYKSECGTVTLELTEVAKIKLKSPEDDADEDDDEE